MKKLFLVHTPFQLISVLNIIIENFELTQCEIVFLHKNLEKYIDSIDKKIRVYFYKDIYENIKFKNNLLNRINLIVYACRVKKYLTRVENSKVQYDEIFIPSKHITCNIIYNYFETFNDIILSIYDEGIGTYLENYFIGKGNKSYRIINKFFCKKFMWDQRKRIYLYRPDLFNSENLNIKVKKIFYNKKNYENFLKLLQLKEKQKYLEAKIIVLEQGNVYKEEENVSLLIKKFRKILSKSQILIKKHPRLGLNSLTNEVIKSDLSIPFEMVYPELEIENKILVSMYSTGCLTPYILSDKKPYIIFLGCLNTRKVFEDVFNSEFFKKIILFYPKEKILFPKNEKELDEIVEILKYKIN